MPKRIYALLVGINDYSCEVGKLQGCLKDVDWVDDYLKTTFADPRIEVLKDAAASRQNIIDRFRQHLGQAKAGDTVLFHYSGHGARWKAAGEFKKFFPDGKDEGLVCHDSRQEGIYDLADKELAILLAEVARTDPHIAVVLDCCHSGSGTRTADDFTLLNARQTHERIDDRPLASYLKPLDGPSYAELHENGEPLTIPTSRHALLAACERRQKAWEAPDHSGVFTSTLRDVLEQSNVGITYSELFIRCRTAVRKRADNQNPQFETYDYFNAFSGFLGNPAPSSARRFFHVSFEDGLWTVNCGAINGLLGGGADPEKPVEFGLYAEADETPSSALKGHASTIQVDASKSRLSLDFEGDPSVTYQAEITSLPAAPLTVELTGDADGVELFQESLASFEDRLSGVVFVTNPKDAEGARYSVVAEEGSFRLKRRPSGKLISGAKGVLTKNADGGYTFGYSKAAANHLLSNCLKKIARWERTLNLQNHNTQMDPDAVGFRFFEVTRDGEPYEHEGSEVTLDYSDETKDIDGDIGGYIKAKNGTIQPLHIALLQLRDDFGVDVPFSEPEFVPDSDFVPVSPDGEQFYINLDDDEGSDRDEKCYTFMLIVSTEEFDAHLLAQDPIDEDIFEKEVSISGDRGFGKMKARKKFSNEWFTKLLRIRVARSTCTLEAEKEQVLANGGITIKPHPKLTANVGLTAADASTRSVGSGPDFRKPLERSGLKLVGFQRSRGGKEEANILELTNIQNADALNADNPLEIELAAELEEDECILPVAFDGDFILPAGAASKASDGRVQVSIDHIPDIPDNRRSLGKALKLYFFKAYLKRERTNKLCWVKYGDDGSVERHEDGLEEKINAASNILLVIHGIIGDTEGMAGCMRKSKGSIELSHDFDLILTYDYENLKTPIPETARTLGKQLKAAGLHEEGGRRVTILAHSMGGLVSRWFIEKEGGSRLVDHLVMCGTPNAGSPFGKIGEARQLTSLLTTIALNTIPGFAPFGGMLLGLLFRSAKVTPTLEQMNPDSEFFLDLNSSDDPGVRYTILAGDVGKYEEVSSQLFQQLLTKIGSAELFSKLFGTGSHDIAVSVGSIRAVPDSRSPSPLKKDVDCHHLNYFGSENGLKALSAVEWRNP